MSIKFIGEPYKVDKHLWENVTRVGNSWQGQIEQLSDRSFIIAALKTKAEPKPDRWEQFGTVSLASHIFQGGGFGYYQITWPSDPPDHVDSRYCGLEVHATTIPYFLGVNSDNSSNGGQFIGLTYPDDPNNPFGNFPGKNIQPGPPVDRNGDYYDTSAVSPATADAAGRHIIIRTEGGAAAGGAGVVTYVKRYEEPAGQLAYQFFQANKETGVITGGAKQGVALPQDTAFTNDNSRFCSVTKLENGGILVYYRTQHGLIFGQQPYRWYVVGISPGGQATEPLMIWENSSNNTSSPVVGSPWPAAWTGQEMHANGIAGNDAVAFMPVGPTSGPATSRYLPDAFGVAGCRVTYDWTTQTISAGPWHFLFECDKSLTTFVRLDPPPESYGAAYKGVWNSTTGYSTGDIVGTTTNDPAFGTVVSTLYTSQYAHSGQQPSGNSNPAWRILDSDALTTGGSDSPNPQSSAILEPGVLGLFTWSIHVKPCRFAAIELVGGNPKVIGSVFEEATHCPVDDHSTWAIERNKLGFYWNYTFEGQNGKFDNNNRTYSGTISGSIKWTRAQGWHEFEDHESGDDRRELIGGSPAYAMVGHSLNPKRAAGAGGVKTSFFTAVSDFPQTFFVREWEIEGDRLLGEASQVIEGINAATGLLASRDAERVEALADDLLVGFWGGNRMQLLERAADEENPSIVMPCDGYVTIHAYQTEDTDTTYDMYAPFALHMTSPVEKVIRGFTNTDDSGTIEWGTTKHGPYKKGAVIELEYQTYYSEGFTESDPRQVSVRHSSKESEWATYPSQNIREAAPVIIAFYEDLPFLGQTKNGFDGNRLPPNLLVSLSFSCTGKIEGAPLDARVHFDPRG